MASNSETVRKVCLCQIPNPPKKANGDVAGNVCQDCQGVVPPVGTDPQREIGGLIIQVQGTLAELPFPGGDTERAEYASYLRRTLRETWRQKLLGWQNNRACAKIKG